MPNSKKIRVITDATDETGFGHASRCLNIASAVLEAAPDTQIVFEGAYSEPAYIRITSAGFRTSATGTIWTEDELILHDRYGLKQSDVNALRASASVLVVIDDFQLLDLSISDCVINFRVNAENLFHYGSPNDLLGLNFFPVPRGLKSVRKANVDASICANKILVFVGGGATAEDEYTLATTCVEARPFAEVVLVTRHHAQIPTNFKLRCEAPRDSIAEFLDWADVLVCGGGLTKYEAGYCGKPSACISQTDGQDQDTKILANNSLTFDLGTRSQTPVNALLQNLDRFFDPKNLASIRQACLDTYVENSDRQVAQALLSLAP